MGTSFGRQSSIDAERCNVEVSRRALKNPPSQTGRAIYEYVVGRCLNRAWPGSELCRHHSRMEKRLIFPLKRVRA